MTWENRNIRGKSKRWRRWGTIRNKSRTRRLWTKHKESAWNRVWDRVEMRNWSLLIRSKPFSSIQNIWVFAQVQQWRRRLPRTSWIWAPWNCKTFRSWRTRTWFRWRSHFLRNHLLDYSPRTHSWKRCRRWRPDWTNCCRREAVDWSIKIRNICIQKVREKYYVQNSPTSRKRSRWILAMLSYSQSTSIGIKSCRRWIFNIFRIR